MGVLGCVFAQEDAAALQSTAVAVSTLLSLSLSLSLSVRRCVGANTSSGIFFAAASSTIAIASVIILAPTISVQEFARTACTINIIRPWSTAHARKGFRWVGHSALGPVDNWPLRLVLVAGNTIISSGGKGMSVCVQLYTLTADPIFLFFATACRPSQVLSV